MAEEIQPVQSGNITQFNTNWIESTEISLIQSIQQLIGSIKNISDILNGSTADQLNDNVKKNKKNQVSSVRRAYEKTVAVYNKTVLPLVQNVASALAQIESIKRNIDSLLLSDVLDILGLAAGIQALMQIPATIVSISYSRRTTAFNDFAIGVAGQMPTGNSSEDKNEASVYEAFLAGGVLGALGLIATTSINLNSLDIQGLFIRTRPQAFEFAETLSALFIFITETLDGAQTNFSDQTLDNQDFSQSQSFSDST